MVIFTELKDGVPPAIVICPRPPNSTVPVLENAVPSNVRVAELDGLKSRVPLLLIVPPLLNVLLNVCVDDPPTNVAPLPMVNVPPVVHAVTGEIPPVLLMLTFANVGLVTSVKAGATFPLKFTVPELLNPEFIVIICTPVPVKVAVPLLVKFPVFEKLPENDVVVPPAVYVPITFIVTFTTISLKPV